MAREVARKSVQRIVMALSREELYVVMRLLKAKQIPGFDLTWLNMAPNGSAAEDVQMVLEAAANGLIARGYLSPASMPTGVGPVHVSMPSSVIALVGTAAFSDYTIFLSLRHTPTGPLRVYLHGFQKLAVLHSMSMTSIHLFEPLDGRDGVLKAVNELFHLRSQTSLSLPEGEVSASAMESAQEAAIAGNVALATQLLLEGGLPPQTAQALAHAIHEALVIGAIATGSRNADKGVVHMTCAVVITSEICLLLTDSTSESSTLLVQPISAEMLQNLIIPFIKYS